MKDLSPAELEELADNLHTVIEDMALIGLDCIVIIEGRGHSRVAYSKDIALIVPMILQSAIKSADAHNAASYN